MGFSNFRQALDQALQELSAESWIQAPKMLLRVVTFAPLRCSGPFDEPIRSFEGLFGGGVLLVFIRLVEPTLSGEQVNSGAAE